MAEGQLGDPLMNIQTLRGRISPLLWLPLALLLFAMVPRPVAAQPPTLTVDEALVAVYTGMYQRAPDLEGLQFWRDVVAAQFGFGPQDPVTDLGFMRRMTAQFGQFPTFAVLYLGLDDAAFVTAIYNNVAGRNPDPEGLAYWVGRLGGTIPGEAPVSRTEMIADFIFGTLMTDLQDPAFAGLTPEQRAAAQGAQDTARNRVLVGTYYVQRLGAGSNLGIAALPSYFNTDPGSPTYVQDAASLQAFLESYASFQRAMQALAGVTADPATVDSAYAFVDSLESDPGGTYLVTATAGAGGSISPSAQAVSPGSTAIFTVTTDSGYGIVSVSGCEGVLEGAVYTTGAITEDCSVSAVFGTALCKEPL